MDSSARAAGALLPSSRSRHQTSSPDLRGYRPAGAGPARIGRARSRSPRIRGGLTGWGHSGHWTNSIYEPSSQQLRDELQLQDIEQDMHHYLQEQQPDQQQQQQQRPDWVYEVMQEERRLTGADLDGAEGGQDHARSQSEA